MKKYLAVASALVFGGSTAVFAATIPVNYDTFGSLSAATFGGSGIPNTSVAQTTANNGNTTTVAAGDTITFGLSATARYSNPTVTDNGAGVFFASPGENNGLTSPGHALGATWNFDYYINIAETPGAAAHNYHVVLLYGNNTAGVQNTMDFGPLGAGTYQDSQNLDFFPFDLGIAFDPNANAQYGFELELLNSDNRVVASDSINVNVGHVPDGASTAMLLGCGFAGLALLRRFQLRAVSAK